MVNGFNGARAMFAPPRLPSPTLKVSASAPRLMRSFIESPTRFWLMMLNTVIGSVISSSSMWVSTSPFKMPALSAAPATSSIVGGLVLQSRWSPVVAVGNFTNPSRSASLTHVLWMDSAVEIPTAAPTTPVPPPWLAQRMTFPSLFTSSVEGVTHEERKE